MDKVPNISWWASMGLGKPDPVPDTDYADMGTAFGLDASMAPRDPDERDAPDDSLPRGDRSNGRSVR